MGFGQLSFRNCPSHVIGIDRAEPGYSNRLCYGSVSQW